MTEDKAGWGLVPGLQAPLLHTHSGRSVGSSYYCWAGLGWAGCAGARSSLHTPAREEKASSLTSLGAKPDLPVSLRLRELESVSEKPIQHANGQQQHCQHSASQEAGGTAEDGSQHR